MQVKKKKNRLLFLTLMTKRTNTFCVFPELWIKVVFATPPFRMRFDVYRFVWRERSLPYDDVSIGRGHRISCLHVQYFFGDIFRPPPTHIEFSHKKSPNIVIKTLIEGGNEFQLFLKAIVYRNYLVKRWLGFPFKKNTKIFFTTQTISIYTLFMSLSSDISHVYTKYL